MSERERAAELREERRPALGQVELTDDELRRLPLGNQYTARHRKPVMCWQAVKAAALYYEVSDWISIVDAKLTYEENIELLRRRGTYGADAGPSMKRAPVRNLEARPDSQ